MKKTVSLKKLIVFTLVLTLIQSIKTVNAQTSGITESNVIINIDNSGNTFYGLLGLTGYPGFDGSYLGTFTPNQSLAIVGGQNKTFKCGGCSISACTLYYRVYPLYTMPGIFSSMNLPLASNDPGGCGGNQTWRNLSNTANILNGLNSGTYAIEVYTTADFAGCGSGSLPDNNGSANYRATFSVDGPVAQYSGTTVAASTTATGTNNTPVTVSNGTISPNCTNPVNILRVSSGAFNQNTPVNYLEFCVRPEAGFSFTVSSVKISIKKTGVGPHNGRIDYNANNSGFVTGPTFGLTTTATNCTSPLPLQSITLSGVTVTDTATGLLVRAYFWTNGTGTGNLDFANITVNGTVSETAAPPKLALPSASSFTYNSATIGAYLFSNSGSSITARGTVYRTSPGVTANDNTLPEGGTSFGNFIQSRTGLSSQTLYYYAGYATNSFGTGLSSEATFRTRSKPPVSQASGLTATAGSAASVNLSWSSSAFPSTGASRFGYMIIYATGSPAVIAAPNGLAPASVIANGSLSAVVSSVTPAMPPTTATATGLNGNTAYNFLVIPYTWDGTNISTYSYLTAGAPSVSATTFPANYQWVGSNGSWNNASNWLPAQVPANQDAVTFNNTGTVTISDVPNVSLTCISATGTSDITLMPSSGGGKTITLYNTSTALNISAGASLSVSGYNGNNLSLIFSGSGNSVSIDGTFNLLSSSAGSGNYTATNSVTTVNGTFRKETSSVLQTTSSNFIVGSTGKFQLGGNALSIPVATWQTGSTCEIAVTAGGTLTGLGQSFSNFTVNCPSLTSNLQCNGALTTITNDLNILNTNFSNGKSFRLTNTAAYIISINGNLAINNNACLDITSGTPYTSGIATINLQGDLSISGSGMLEQSGSAFANFNFNRLSGIQNITLENSGSISQAEFAAAVNIGDGNSFNIVKLNSDMSLGNFYISDLSVNAGSTFDMGNYVVQGWGCNFIANASTVLKIGNADGITSSSTAGNIQVTGNRIFNSQAKYVYAGSVNQNSGDGLPAFVNFLEIANTGSPGNNTVSLNKDDSTNILRLTSGLFNTNGNTQTICNNGTLAASAGNFSLSSAGIISFSKGSVTGTVNFYPDVIIRGGVNFGTSSVINKSLQINAGGSVLVNPVVYSATSSLKYCTGSVFTRNIEWSSTAGAGYPNNVWIKNNTTLDLSANGFADRACAGNLYICSGSLIMNLMPNSLTVGNNIIIDGTLSLGTVSGSDIHVKGNWTLNNTGTFNSNNQKVFLEGSTSSIAGGTTTSLNFDYLQVNKTTPATVSLNKNITAAKSLTITNGIINTGIYKVTIPPNSVLTRISGHVNGNLEKYVATGTGINYNFETGDSINYAPVLVRFINVTGAGYLTASTMSSDHPDILSSIFDGYKTVNRCWMLSNNGVVFPSYTITFNYASSDLDPGVNTSTVFCGRFNGSLWDYPSMSARTSTSAKCSTLTSFGSFQIGHECTIPVLSSTATKVSCKNGSNGTINIIENGGSPPFTYLWSNWATTKNLSGIPAGTYTVTVKGQGGCTATVSATVTQPATAITTTVSNNGPVCAGNMLNLTGTASGGTGKLIYNWSGPNGFTSTINSPSISNSSANIAGNYSLLITDSNNCTLTKTTSVIVNTVTPVITGAASFCSGSATTLSTGSFPSYQWSNGATTQSITINNGGTYTVSVTQTNGCTGADSLVTTVIPVVSPSISITANPGIVACAGMPVTFAAVITNGGATPSRQWYKNNIAVGVNSNSYTDSNLVSGDAIKCKVTSPCATPASVPSNIIKMTIDNTVSVSAGIGPLVICGSGSANVYGKINNATTGYSGTWSTTAGAGTFNNTNWNGISGVTYTADATDAGKTIYLVLTGPPSGTCPGQQDSIAVNVNYPASIIPGTINNVCKGVSSFNIPYTLVSGAPTQYTLSASAPNPMSNFSTINAQPLPASNITVPVPNSTVAGTYNFALVVFNSICNSVTYNLQLTINNNPTINATASPATICSGSSTTLTATGGTAYTWMPGSLPGTSINISPSSSTTYTVTGTNANGCSSSKTILITVNPLPTPSIIGASSFCYGGSAVLDATNSYNNYNWSNGAASQTTSVNSTGTYTVTVTNGNNCSASVSMFTSANPAIAVTASASSSSIQAGDTIQLSSTASGSVSGITYSVTSKSYAPVTGTGTAVPLGDDQLSGTLPIGFNFRFYGIEYSSFYISSNGFITFNPLSNDGCCQGPPIPNYNAGNVSNMIALAWNDLNAAGGTIDYFTTGSSPNRKLVVRFTISHINGNPVNTQAILYEGTNKIEIHSATIPNMTSVDPSYISTMGVENDGGTVASTVPGRNGQGWSATNDAWVFTPNASYSYSWNPPSYLSNANIKNPAAVPLNSTVYTVTATAYNGCTGTASQSISVSHPYQLTVFVTATEILCYGANATVTVSAVGGIPPYTGTGNYTVAAGTYTYTVTDAAGTSSSTIAVTQPAKFTAASSVTSISCYGGNATINVTASGGTLPYSGTGSFSVTAGTYTYTVTDAKGCTSSTTKIVTQPSVFLCAAQATPINCYGNSSTVTVAASGGTQPYSGTGNFNVNAGNYTYTVTDSKGCTSSAALSVTQPSQLTASTYATSAICYGGTSPVTINATGGTPPYSGTGNLIVPAGNYNYVITDSLGCSASVAVTVNQLPSITCSTTLLQNVSCNSGSDGKIQLLAGNGTSPYSYVWSNGTTGKARNGLTAGTYTVTVTDGLGCSISASYTLTEPPALYATCSGTNVNCKFGTNGTAMVTAAGGTGPFTYQWNNGTTSQSANGLGAGNYTVTVSDSNGCTVSCIITITQPTLLSIGLTGNDVSCSGGNNGSAVASASGGVSPYSYQWSNGFTNAALNGLTATNYTVTVTDDNGCSTTKSLSVNQPSPLSITFSITNVSCNGKSDGKAIANVAGGTTPYSYLWNNGNADKTANTITAGTYTVTVTDGRGCAITATAVVTQPSAVTSVCSAMNVTCNGNADGSASVTGGGGVSPYTYLWSNGNTTTSINNLAPGNYTITVTDAGQCDSKTTISITQPGVLSISGTATSVSCNGAGNGSAPAIPSGGNPPYSFQWSTMAVTSVISNLSPGNYTVTVTDAKGCSSTKSYSITQPSILATSLSSTNVSCNGAANGSITANPAGGTSPYNYQWNNGATSKTVSNIAFGTYTVTVTDTKGCTVTGSNVITEPTALAFTVNTQKNVTCNGGNTGKLDITISGGTSPYTCLWSNGSTAKIISNLTAGTYTITATDNKGCTKSTSYIITQPAPIAVPISKTNPAGASNNGLATAGATGGTSPYTYLWLTTPSKTTATITGLGPGTYTVQVTDANGCTQTASTTLIATGSSFPGNETENTRNHADEKLSNNELNMSVVPNPGNGIFTLKINSDQAADANIRLYDGTARIRFTENISLEKGINETPVNLSLAKGLYILKVTTATHTKNLHVIIQ